MFDSKNLLIIDNHDSFTFNLVDLLRPLCRELNIPMQIVFSEELDLDEVDNFSHILISPGPDVPRAYPNNFAMLERYSQRKSILGVCLGHQTIAEFFGGELYNLAEVRHGQQRPLSQLEENPLFDSLPESVNGIQTRNSANLRGAVPPRIFYYRVWQGNAT